MRFNWNAIVHRCNALLGLIKELISKTGVGRSKKTLHPGKKPIVEKRRLIRKLKPYMQILYNDNSNPARRIKFDDVYEEHVEHEEP